MEPPFYHVDRRGDLSVGDTLDINWDLEIIRKESTYILDSQYENQIREDFSRGLSAHGTRYIHSFYEVDHNQRYYKQNPYTGIPTPISGSENNCLLIENGLNEWYAESIRRDRFPDEWSRLKSYFAWPSEGVIDGFGTEDYSVCEVVPTDFELRDMNLLNSIEGIEKYWDGDLTHQPKPEVVMKGPVEIVNIY